MKRMKTWLAISLSIAMICGMFGVFTPNTTEAAMPTTEYFTETFSTDNSFDKTWKTNVADIGTWTQYVSNGKLCIPGTNDTAMYLLADDEVLTEQSDYTVSCKVQFGAVPTADTNVAIVARATAANTTGYEMQLTVKADELPIVRLRDRKAGKYFTNSVKLSDFDCTESNELAVTIIGNDVICSINGNEVLTYDISTKVYADGTTAVADTSVYTAGAAAIRLASVNTGFDITFDDFKVYRTVDYKFCDDFNSYEGTNAQKRTALLSKGWYVSNNANAGLANGEAYKIPSDNAVSPIVLQTEHARGALGWNDYSVEADVTIGEGTLATDVYACVTGRHTTVGGNDGYEIQLYETTEGAQGVQILARGKGGLVQCGYAFERGTTYNLKAVFQGNTIYAYINDVLVLQTTDDTYPIGYAGIRKMGKNCGVDVTFDNFVVYDYDVVPPTFVEDFEGYVPNNLGTEEDPLYDYTQLRAKGWWSKNTSGIRACASYAANGKLTVPTGTTTETNMVLSEHDTAANWRNYTVECDIVFNSDSVSAGATWASIAGRETATSGTGFALLLGVTAAGQYRYLRLQKDGSTVVNADPTTSERIAAGTPIHVKLKFNENLVIGYVNGVEEVRYEMEETEIQAGYAGLHVPQVKTTGCVDVTFDNFIVYDTDNPYTKELVGDFDANTVVNTADMTLLKEELLAKDTFDNATLDVNKSAATDIFDYVRIKRLVYSLENDGR